MEATLRVTLQAAALRQLRLRRGVVLREGLAGRLDLPGGGRLVHGAGVAAVQAGVAALVRVWPEVCDLLTRA